MITIENSKSEIRNPKQIPKIQTTNPKRQRLRSVKAHGVGVWVWDFPFWNLGFVSDFEFRISNFSFPQ